jgi:aspartyl-tRNA(Asn)/glutamyl-tRNA(Gln) amidotransferase subunit A
LRNIYTEVNAGGSSGGSAVAVAANLCMGSIGTDTAGSIRVLAACCGVVGLKPTYGLIDMNGIMPLSWSLDHTGPIARNVQDLALIMESITRRPYQKAYGSSDIKGMRIGIPKQYFNERMDADVENNYYEALKVFENLGANVIEVDVEFAYESINVAHTLATAEVGYVHREFIKSSLNYYSEGAKELFSKSKSISSHDYFESLNAREKMTSTLIELFNTVDIIVTPTMPVVPTNISLTTVQFNSEKESVDDCLIRFPSLFNITGHPALSIPCGLSTNSLPIGLQMIANHNREDLLLKAAFSFEQSTLFDFYRKRDNRCSERSLY